MRQSAGNLSTQWLTANELLGEIDAKLSRLVALNAEFPKKPSPEKTAAISEENRILQRLIADCDDRITDLRDGCLATSDRIAETPLWRKKITALVGRLESSTKTFKRLVYEFEKQTSKISRALKSHASSLGDEEMSERINGNLTMSSLMLESQISVAEDTLASMERQHDLLQRSARKAGYIKKRLKESARLINAIIRRECTNQICIYAGMVLVLFAMFLMWLFWG